MARYSGPPDTYFYIQADYSDGGLEIRDSDSAHFIDISAQESDDDVAYIALTREQARALRDHLTRILLE